MKQKSVDAGSLRHRVAVQSKTEARDAHGGVTESWSTATTRWAKIEPAVGREFYYGQQVANDITHFVTIRSYSSLTTSMRLLFETTRILNIKSIHEPDEITNFMVIHCTESK